MPVFVLVPIAFAGSLVYGLTGFGSGLITVPLASFFFDLPFVLAVFALIDGLNAVRVWTSMPRAVSWPDAGRLMRWVDASPQIRQAGSKRSKYDQL